MQLQRKYVSICGIVYAKRRGNLNIHSAIGHFYPMKTPSATPDVIPSAAPLLIVRRQEEPSIGKKQPMRRMRNVHTANEKQDLLLLKVLALKGVKWKSQIERRYPRIMSVCSPSTSIVLYDSDECGIRMGDATSGPLSSLTDKRTIDFACCSVTLQKINLPNNTQRCERDALRSKLTFDALQPKHKQSPLAKPLCRRECVTIDVEVCRRGSMKAVCWTAQQKLSTTLNAQTPISHRRSVHLQRLQLCTDVPFDDHIHLEYKRLKTKRIVEYKIPHLL
uniref:Uncharacterized protein n=1 Tax=Ascaris lumbricoides TaxID=6252 RepID=A0A0M3I8L1_ASCLU